MGWGEHGSESQKGSSGFSLADVLVPVFFARAFHYTSHVWLRRTTCEPLFTPPVEL